MNTTETEQRTHAYLRPFQYYDACRMRLWRETRACQNFFWVMFLVVVAGLLMVGLCYFL